MLKITYQDENGKIITVEVSQETADRVSANMALDSVGLNLSNQKPSLKIENELKLLMNLFAGRGGGKEQG